MTSAITYIIISHSFCDYLLNWPLLLITGIFPHFFEITRYVEYIVDFVGFIFAPPKDQICREIVITYEKFHFFLRDHIESIDEDFVNEIFIYFVD